MRAIQFASKKSHRTRHSRSNVRVSKKGQRCRSLLHTDLKKNVITQPVPICSQNIPAVEHNNEQSVSIIHSTAASMPNDFIDDASNDRPSSMSYMNQVFLVYALLL